MKFMRRCRLWWLVLPILAIDRLLKYVVRAALAPSGVLTLIPGVLSIAYTENSGAAFSLLAESGPWLLIALTAALIVGVCAWLLLRPDAPTLERVGLWMIVGGGLGNLWDRLVYGSVTDFIRLDFIHFAIFNFADICVCVGALLAAISLISGGRGRADG